MKWIGLALILALSIGCGIEDELPLPPVNDELIVNGFLRAYEFDPMGGGALGAEVATVTGVDTGTGYSFPSVFLPYGTYKVRAYFTGSRADETAIILVRECELEVTMESDAMCSGAEFEAGTLVDAADMGALQVSGETIATFLESTFADFVSPCANLLDCDGNGTSNFDEGNAMSFDGF